MRHIRALVTLAMLGAALPSSAQTAPSRDPADTPDIIGSGPSASDRVTIPISIDGKGSWNFIVDTGAQRTVIARDLARKLALAPAESVRVLSMDGMAETDTVTIPRIRFGQTVVDDIEAPVLEAEHLGAPGLLGLDGLQAKRLLLNFRTGKMEISSSSRHITASSGDTIIVQARRRKGQLILLNSHVNGVAVDIMLDTGTDISVGNIALRDQLVRKNRLATLQPSSLTSATGGELTGLLGRIDDLRIGGASLRGVDVLFADAAPFAELKLRDKPALLLGVSALRVFDRVAIDFGAKRVDFLLPDMGALDRAHYAASGGAG
jgi:predicted aspartyl protease